MAFVSSEPNCHLAKILEFSKCCVWCADSKLISPVSVPVKTRHSFSPLSWQQKIIVENIPSAHIDTLRCSKCPFPFVSLFIYFTHTHVAVSHEFQYFSTFFFAFVFHSLSLWVVIVKINWTNTSASHPPHSIRMENLDSKPLLWPLIVLSTPLIVYAYSNCPSVFLFVNKQFRAYFVPFEHIMQYYFLIYAQRVAAAVRQNSERTVTDIQGIFKYRTTTKVETK